MSARFCSVCGAVLRDGVCPNGHPQRASRRQARRRARSGFGRAIVLLVVLALLVGGAYVALVWYPQRAAGDLMRPSSEEFATALVSYQETVAAFPPGPTDPTVLVDTSNVVLTEAGQAREELTRASGSLEARAPTDLPVVSSRSPLQLASDVRQQMLAFYSGALEAVASLEAVAGYLTVVAGTFPRLDDLEGTLAEVEEPAEAGTAVATATPIADQLIADLQAVTPPDELGALHTSLLAVARRIRADLDEVAAAGQSGTGPLVRALLQDVTAEVTTFRETVGTAPKVAGDAGLALRLEDVDVTERRVVEGLEELRDVHGLSGLTVPQEAVPPAGD
jgi:hypothetical protein